jgi:large exoprotein involved in heme utilization and adhesion
MQKTISVMIGDENSFHSFDDLSVKSGEAAYFSGAHFLVPTHHSYWTPI